MRCQCLFREAHALLDEVNEELVGCLGFGSMDEYEAFIGDEYENDMTIDTLELCQGVWDKKSMRAAISFLESRLRYRGVV